jgi:hypothetical protein
MGVDQAGTTRSGEPWAEDEDARLVKEIRAGRPTDDIAVLLQRSASAVRSRLRWLIPSEQRAAVKASERESWLREALNSPTSGYDWREALRENYAADGRRYWSAADMALLREGWRLNRPLPALAEELSASEVDVTLQLCRSGLADSVREVVDRLGATPGGTVEIRARMALDRAAASVWVLIADGVGRRVSAFNRRRRHVSIHGSCEEAEHRLGELLLDAEERGYGPVKWSIVCRSVGEDTAGEETHDATSIDDAAS